MQHARTDSLDGLRGVAVTAVVLYHVDHTLVPGGFIGVDLFFVLSGYLITTLLIGERESTGRISLRSFWGRRIRRLWPLSWITLALIAAASLTGVWGPDRQRTLPADLGAAFAQIANWHQIGNGGYVQSLTAPSPVRHFWSLAIEEQFYVVWPLVIAGLLSRAPTVRRWLVPSTFAALAAGSVVAGILVHDQPDRAYLGTDVRLVALVVGAGLAWAWRDRPMRGPDVPRTRTEVTVVGSGAGIALLIATVLIEADTPWLATGGFALVALGSAAVVAAAITSPAWGAVLGWGPLVWLGRVSFAVYLIHWPVLVAIGPDRPLWLRFAVAGPCSVVLAAAAHRWVERPIIDRRVSTRTLSAGTFGLVAASIAALVIAVPRGQTPTEQVAESFGTIADPTTVPSTSPSSGAGAGAGPTTGPTTTACVVAPPERGPDDTTPTDRPPTERSVGDPTTADCTGQIKVLVLGDSTGRSAANGLAALNDPRILLWDRTVLGCSFGDETCPDWRVTWPTEVAKIQPDVVVVFAGVVSDLHGIDDGPFLDPAASLVRVAQLDEAITKLSSTGAAVFLTAPPVPLRPNGLFFCDGAGRNSNCDPRWVEAWTAAVRTAATNRGAAVIDTAAWLADRGNSARDRPDGLHLAGQAVTDHARWLILQIIGAGDSVGATPGT